jgi:hypothetical protein
VGSFAAPADQQNDGGLFLNAGVDGTQSVSESPAVKRTRLVSVDFQMLASSTVGETLVLNLFPDVAFEAVITNIEPSGDGYTWIGHLDGVALSQVVLVEGGGQMAANISMPGAFYQVRYAGGGVHAIYQIDQSAYPPELEPKQVPAPTGESSQSTDEIQVSTGLQAATADDGSVIDVMVVYTPLAASRAGGTTAMQNEINLAVAETNLSYANSGINQRINLVHTAEVSYNEAGSMETDLDRLTYKSDGYLDNVHDLRDTYNADIVSLIAERNDYCGIGWIMGSVSHSFEEYAFNVVARDCLAGIYVLAHELGHNMGAGHDWYVFDLKNYPYSYNKGYVNTQARWVTVMAYSDECYARGFNCTRLPNWSNPDVLYGGNPTGVPIGTSTSCRAGDINHPACDADNRQVLNNTAYTVANFRVGGSSGTVGPVEYVGHSIDDDTSGDSSGNNNGQAECGETIELYVDLRNQGNLTAESVSASISTTDPYVTWTQNTSSGYGDIPGGATRTNSNDFELRLAANTPHGRGINFSLNISASNGGPWSDTFNLTASCPTSADIRLSSTSLSTVQAADQTVVENLEIINDGNANLDWTISENGITGIPADQAIVDASADALLASILVLYDNGPLINSPGTGAVGADESVVQNSIGLDFYGFSHHVSVDERIADDFTVSDPNGWNIETITTFAYQTGSTTSSTINHVNYRIWDGPPGSGGISVVFGDTTTNRLVESTWPSIFRVTDSTSGDTQRPIMANTLSAGVFLPQGTYWLDWQSGGSLGSGPWAPPVTINGQTTTGNALQYTGTWIEARDGGTNTRQGFPFILEGSSGSAGESCSSEDIPWVSVSPPSGTTQPGNSSMVNVAFDSTGLDPGTYTGELCVSSNDPDEDPLFVTLNMLVASSINYLPFIGQ